MSITKNKNKLKGKDSYIENVLTRQERVIYAAVWQVAIQEREEEKIMKIGYKK